MADAPERRKGKDKDKGKKERRKDKDKGKKEKPATMLDELVAEAVEDEELIAGRERRREAKQWERDNAGNSEAGSNASKFSDAKPEKRRDNSKAAKHRRQHAAVTVDEADFDKIRGSLQAATHKPTAHASSSNNNTGLGGSLFSYFDIIGKSISSPGLTIILPLPPMYKVH